MNENEEKTIGKNEPITDAILRFLADNHPDDEAALEQMTATLGQMEGITDNRLLELVYKGVNYEKSLEEAGNKAYVKGRNEAIELESRKRTLTVGDDNGGGDDEPDLPLLRHIRKSVWDD